MLKLTIYKDGDTEGSLVGFKKKTKINIVVSNPMFNDVGLFSYMISVYKEENEHVFNYITDLPNIKSTILTFKLEVGTDIIAQGDVKVTDSDDDYIEFYLKSGNSSVSNFINNNYMNQVDIWGELSGTNVHQESAKTVDYCYPDYPLVVTPIVIDDEVANAYDYEEGDLDSSELYAAVYVRHLIDKLISSFSYAKISDAFDDIDDFNGLAIFSANKYFDNISSFLRLSLPYITIADFLTDLRDRFNIAIYFSPYLYEAEVLNVADTLKLDPVDWTDKFISMISAAPVEEKEVDFTQSSDEDEDIYTADDIADNYNIKTAADLDTFIANAQAWVGWAYYVESLKRYLVYETVSPDYDISSEITYNNFRSETETLNEKTYYTMQDKYNEDTSVVVVNSVTTVNTENFIAQFLFPEWDGTVKDNIKISAYFKSNGTNYLVTKVYKIVKDDPDDVSDDTTNKETLIGYNKQQMTLGSDTFTYQIPICVDEFEISEDVRVAIRFYCYSETAGGTLTMEFGGIEYQVGTLWESEAHIDNTYKQYKEIGCLSDVQYGDNDSETTEFKPSSKIPKNGIYNSNGYRFELPVSSLSVGSAKNQTSFEYLMYRGKRYDIQQNAVGAGYCNFDVLDVNKESYTSKLLSQVEPTLSLAWKGEYGLLNKMWKNRLLWERYFKRDVQMNMDLTINDIINHKIYKPFEVDGIRYVIDQISFVLDENAEVSNVKITAYTL